MILVISVNIDFMRSYEHVISGAGLSVSHAPSSDLQSSLFGSF